MILFNFLIFEKKIRGQVEVFTYRDEMGGSAILSLTNWNHIKFVCIKYHTPCF